MGKRPQTHIRGAGFFGIDVVGESHYQDALAGIAGGYRERSTEIHKEAVLILNDENPYDDKAVRVEIDGYVVGYLDRKNARLYRHHIAAEGHPRLTASCDAIIVGGWDRGGGNVGMFGVKLDLPSDEDIPDANHNVAHARPRPIKSSTPQCPVCQSPMAAQIHTTGQLQGCSAGCLFIAIGILLFIVPVVGWIAGPIMIIVGLFQGGKRNRVWFCRNKSCQHVMPRLVYSAGEKMAIGTISVLVVVIGYAIFGSARTDTGGTNTQQRDRGSRNDQRDSAPIAEQRNLRHEPMQPATPEPPPPPALFRGMTPEEVTETLGVEGRKKFGMKDREGVQRDTYEWVTQSGIIEGKFEDGKLAEWETPSQ